MSTWWTSRITARFDGGPLDGVVLDYVPARTIVPPMSLFVRITAEGIEMAPGGEPRASGPWARYDWPLGGARRAGTPWTMVWEPQGSTETAGRDVLDRSPD